MAIWTSTPTTCGRQRIPPDGLQGRRLWPTWDCGGTNIAYTSTRDETTNIFQVYWQGGGSSNLTIHPATDKWSQWSPSKESASRGK